MVGILIALTRPLLGLWGIRQLSRVSVPVTDAPAQVLAAECAAVLHLTRRPALRQAATSVPMTWGSARPVVLLPLGAENWSEDRLRAVLLHEVSHIRRADWLGHRFADLVCALYWFHPLVWLTARRLRAESEAACDDLVLASGIPAPDYARHLLEIARALPVSAVPETAIAMAQTSQIESRLKMILSKTQNRRQITRRIFMTALGLSAVSVLSLAVLRPVVQAQALPTTKQSVGNTNPVTVQLIGLTDAGLTRGKGKGWDAGGVRLSPALYQKATALPIGMDPYPGARVVNVALHISPDTAQDLTLSYQFSHCDAYGEDAGGLEKQAESNGLASAEYARVGGNRLLTVRFPTSVTKTDIRVSISSGVWQKDTCTVTPLAQTLDGSSYQMVTFPEAGKEFRVVAIDTNGVRRLPSSSMDHGNGMPTSRALHQIVAQFNNLPPAQIREILLETRPIVWKEFKDVALQSVKSR